MDYGCCILINECIDNSENTSARVILRPTSSEIHLSNESNLLVTFKLTAVTLADLKFSVSAFDAVKFVNLVYH